MTRRVLTAILSFAACSFASPIALYVSSHGSVLRYDAATGASMNPYVTSGSGGLNAAYGLVFGPNGNLFVASEGSNQILEYNAATGAFDQVFVSSSTGIFNPIGLAFSPAGDLFVASNNNNKIVEYDPSGALIGTFANSSSGLDYPTGLVFGPNGNLFVSSEYNNEVLESIPPPARWSPPLRPAAAAATVSPMASPSAPTAIFMSPATTACWSMTAPAEPSSPTSFPTAHPASTSPPMSRSDRMATSTWSVSAPVRY